MYTLIPVIPPLFAGAGTLTSGSPAVTGFVAGYTPLAGQEVTGTGVPVGATVLASPAPTSSTFTMSANATATGSQALTIGAAPITLADAKLHARVEYSDDDTLITSLIIAATRVCETRSKRAFVTQTFDMILDSFPFGGGYYNRMVRQFYGAFPGASGATWPGFLPTNTGLIELPHPPLIAVTSIKYLDSGGALQTLDPSVYAVVAGTPGRINPAYGKIWPVTYPQIGAVIVRFSCGYGAAAAVPDTIKTAIRILVAYHYERREPGETMAIPQALDFTIDSLLGAEEWGGYG